MPLSTFNAELKAIPLRPLVNRQCGKSQGMRGGDPGASSSKGKATVIDVKPVHVFDHCVAEEFVCTDIPVLRKDDDMHSVRVKPCLVRRPLVVHDGGVRVEAMARNDVENKQLRKMLDEYERQWNEQLRNLILEKSSNAKIM